MKFTDEQKEWMVINCPLFGFKKATEEFNRIFNQNRSYDTIRTHCIRNGIKVSEETKSSINRLKKSKLYSVGDIFMSHGYKYIKTGTGHKQMPYHRYIWEQANGPLSKDYSIIFLDGDVLNCDISNLMAVTNRVKALLNDYNLWSSDKEIMLTAIKWCELRLALLDSGAIKDLHEKEKELKYYDGVDLGAIQQKVQAKSKSGVKGVTWDSNRNKWRATIEFRGTSHMLGRFEDVNDAIKARKDAEKLYFEPIIEGSKLR